MRKIKTIVCFVLAALIVVTMTACGNPTNPSGSTQASGGSTAAPGGSTSAPGGNTDGSPTDEYVKLTVGFQSQLGRLYAGLTPTENTVAVDGLYDVIFRADPATKEIFSYCLDDWYWEDDTTFIMKLRQGVMFSNGAEATAEDVVYSYTSYEERGSTVLNVYGILWDECYARDKYTAVIKLEKFYAPFEQWPVYLHCKQWCQEVGWDSMEWFNPVGSGPYYCDLFSPDDRIILKARDDYWDAERQGPIYVDEFEIVYYPDESTAYMDLETGKVDVVLVSAANYSRFLDQGGDGFDVTLIPIGTNNNFYYSYLNNEIWYNKDLREALTIGVDWVEIGKVIHQDNFIQAKSICPVDSPDFIDVGWDTVEYDPDRAKEILADLGYGPDNPLKLFAYNMSTATTGMEAIQFYYSQIGVELGLEFVDIATAMDIWRTRAGEPGVVDIGYHHSRRGSPAFEMRMSIMYARMPEQSFTWVDDENGKFAELYDVLIADTDADARKQAAHDIQQLVRDEYLFVPIAEVTEALGYRTDKLTEKQVMDYVVSGTVMQISRLGMLSAWE